MMVIVLKEMQEKKNKITETFFLKILQTQFVFIFLFPAGFQLIWPQLVRIKRNHKNDVRILLKERSEPLYTVFKADGFILNMSLLHSLLPSLSLHFGFFISPSCSETPPGPLCANDALIKGKKKVEEILLHEVQKTSVCVCAHVWVCVWVYVCLFDIFVSFVSCTQLLV